MCGLKSGVSLLIPLTGAFPTFFAFEFMTSADKSDWLPAISVRAGSAL